MFSKIKKERKKYINLIEKSGLFDEKYYLKHNRDARRTLEPTLEHFVKVGLQEDRKPNEAFDPIWYKEYYSDIKENGIYPFIHFLQYGLKENRFQNAQEKKEYERLQNSFDVVFYKNSYDDLKVQEEGFDFVLHYIRYGKKEGRKIQLKHTTKPAMKEEDIILQSGLFDKNYYLECYKDVAKNGIEPVSHYCKYGWKEGRNPSREFDTIFYLENNLDVKNKGINPLVHYIRYGKKEGRKVKGNAIYPAEYGDYKKLIEYKNSLSVGVVVHIDSLDAWDEILKRLHQVTDAYRLYITTSKELYDDVCKLSMPDGIKTKIYPYEGIGMDIYPFFKLLKRLDKDNVDIFCKLNTKDMDKLIKEASLNDTIGNNAVFSGIVKGFEEDDALQMVGSSYLYKNIAHTIRDNPKHISPFIEALNIEQTDLKKYGFFASGILWGRVSTYLALSTNISDELFATEYNTKDLLDTVLGLSFSVSKAYKVALVYKGNENDYFLEKLSIFEGSKDSIGDTVKELNDFEYDVKILDNFRFFNKELYKQAFPYIHGHGIECSYHYLLRGRDIYQPLHIPNKVLELFGYNKQNKKRLLPYIYLGLKGVLAKLDTIDNQDLDFQFTQLKMGIYEAHLIDWKGEHTKKRDSSLVSIVIPVYGQSELTKNCLDSILSTEAGVKYEIIVINNGQDKDDIQQLDSYKKYANIKIIHNKENLNFALGCNLGFSLSIGSRVVFLNNDTTVTNNWLINLVEPLKDKNISMTQPRLLYPDGKLQCMGLVFSDKSKLAYPLYQNQDIPNEIIEKNRLFNAITGACLAINAQDFALVKGFDVSFVNGQEDVDFCLKLNHLKRTKAMYVANSIVYHYEGKTQGRGKFVANNRKLFISRWSKDIIADDMQHYRNDGAEVSEWVLDAEIFKKMQIENYIPKIDFGFEKVVDNSLFVPQSSFYIKGDLETSSKKKTILIAAHSVSKQIFGGERSFLDMVQAIDKERYNLIITIPNRSNSKYIDMLKEHSSGLYVVKYYMWNKKGIDENVLLLLEDILKNEKVELVYANTIMCREVLLAAKNLSVRKVIHVRELIDKDEHLRKVISLNTPDILHELESMSDYIFANSQITSKLFKTQNQAIIYNKIDTDIYKNLQNQVDPNKINFAMLSSNIPKKGIGDFFEIAKICRDIPNAHFILIGPINAHIKEMQKSIKELNLTNITIAGYFDDPVEAIKQTNVVLSLSHFAESFGRTVGEACAGGRPVIAYNYGAIPELIKDGENGYLAKYKDVEDVVRYIRLLCEKPKLIETMGKKGREIIESLASPTIYKNKLNLALQKCFDMKISKPKLDLSIIVPIYNAYDEVTRCIDSVINTTAHLPCNIILIDDASPDERIRTLLSKYKNISNINVVFNEQNMGYTRTVNKGISLANNNDVILLNSDTVVTCNWVENMYKTAYLDNSIGTVTAMSDNAGAFSFPKSGTANPKPENMPYNNYANIILRGTKRELPVEVPTGSGFCFFIKRDLIKEIGLFDYEAFPRGYGEENDFCMRAISYGWKNVITPYAFIFHVRTASFGSEKEQLVKEGVDMVIKRYPRYMHEVKRYFGSKAMRSLRSAVASARDEILVD